MTDEEKVAAEVSPFSPYKNDPYEFKIRGGVYKIRMPKRTEISRALTELSARIVNTSHGLMRTGDHLESFLVEAECFLPLITEGAPPHWYSKGQLDMDLVEGEELGEVWKEVVKHWPGRFSQHMVKDEEKKA